mgnify:CR=1 FL=1|tara:strand:+ start:2386 stop:3327 length:942 start_codon:yes stop_codon:yes gene_type:complete
MSIKKIILFLLVSLTFLEKTNAEITDALFMTIGNKAIAQSDIVNEIKILLILNNETYSDDKRDKLQSAAINSIIKRKVKEIEVERYNFSQFNKKDLNDELVRLADNIKVDIETLKNIFASNELDFSIIENNIIIDLKWNGLIFEIYKNKLSINVDEIDDKLKTNEDKIKLNEYLISEILLPPVETNEISSKIAEIKNKINIEGFENVAQNLGISESASNGGDLGWLKEDIFSKKIKPIILSTPVGEISKAVVLPEGILLFKIRDKRVVESKLTLEERKNQLVNFEKIKILKMHSLSHYDKVRRSVSIKFLRNE